MFVRCTCTQPIYTVEHTIALSARAFVLLCWGFHARAACCTHTQDCATRRGQAQRSRPLHECTLLYITCTALVRRTRCARNECGIDLCVSQPVHICENMCRLSDELCCARRVAAYRQTHTISRHRLAAIFVSHTSAHMKQTEEKKKKTSLNRCRLVLQSQCQIMLYNTNACTHAVCVGVYLEHCCVGCIQMVFSISVLETVIGMACTRFLFSSVLEI